MEPGTEQVVEAKLEHGFEHNTGTPGILEELRKLRGKSESNIARSLSVIPKDGLTLVRVVSSGDQREIIDQQPEELLATGRIEQSQGA